MKYEFNPTYGVAHSRFYKPSVISSLLVERDSKGKVIAVRNDAYLLLRQDSLTKKLGAESIRRYLDGLLDRTHHANSAKLSDDDLMSLIPPREVNNLTTATEWMEYLASHEKDLTERAKDLQSKHTRVRKYLGAIFGNKGKEDPDKTD